MNAAEIMARTIWSEDRSGGARGMEPIAGVILNRAAIPGWWGKDIIGVCLCDEQFDGWNWRDPNFRPMLTVDEGDPNYALAMTIAQKAIGTGGDIERANGATHYFAKSMMGNPPKWYWTNPKVPSGARSPCFETPHHLFFKIGLGA